MTQAIHEFPTANGVFRAARIAFVHALWHAGIVREHDVHQSFFHARFRVKGTLESLARLASAA
jgi:hypothetical protein